MTNKKQNTGKWMLATSLSLALTMSPLSAMAGTSPADAANPVAPADQTVIKGKVLDPSGEPVIGASIIVVGAKTTTGTVTNFDGEFQLNVKPGTKLQVSFVGYDTQTVVAKDGMTVNLAENSTMLQAVEVVAYGVQKKVTMTGAISSVKGEDLVRTPVSSVNNVLAGQLSGVTTIQNSGEPGSDAAEIFVRGKATWGDAAPLIQVDGVERSMSDVDPNEIESITVLKDASATAVFGVRGANGVILITTKRGTEGKTKITGTTSWTMLTPTKMIEQASSYDYATFYNQMRANDGQTAMFTDDVIEKFRTNSDPVRFPSMNWCDYIMKKSTLQQQHNVNISGGNNKVKYFISAGYYSQGGLFKEWDKSWNYGYQYQRFNYRANLDINATKTTTISVNIAGKVDDKDTPRTGQGASGMIKAIYYATPFCSPGFVDGKYVVNSDAATDNLSGDPNNKLPFVGSTPMTYYAYQPGGYHYSNNKISVDLALEQKLDFWNWSKGLSLKLKGSYNTSYQLMTTTTASVATYYAQALENDGIRYRKTGDDVDPSYKTEQTGKARDWYAEGSLNYHRTFGEHTVNGLLLYNQSKEYYPSTYSDIPRTYVGLVGRITYDYANKYLAEFNIGYNGSENFAPGKRFGIFPAGSVGWVVSNEKFWKSMSHAISFLKFRVSMGLVGNDKIGGSRFMYLADPYNVNQSALLERSGKESGTYGYNFGVENGTTSKGAVEAAKNNPEVSWEKALKQDYGVDIYFLKDRLRVNLDYFREHRTDILVRNYNAPTILGMTLPYSNLGETKSWGYEISAGWNDKAGDIIYNAKVNFSYNQNEIIDDYAAPVKETYMETKGKRIGARSLYTFWKYYEGEQTQKEYEETFGSPFPTQLVATSKLKPGDCVYIDWNKDGVIDANDMKRTNDNSYTQDPEYIIGLNLGLTWKRISFSAQFTGAWNVSRVISSVFREPFASAASNSATDGGLLQYHVDNTWTPGINESQDADYPRATWENAIQNYAESTLWEKNASYLRLKTLSFGYDFINPAFKSIGMRTCELSFSAYNLFTITSYKWGDPEATASSSPSYPLQRTYTLSLKIGF